MADAVAEETAAHPGVPVEVFCTDEHRLGLKPILRSVWAKLARGHAKRSSAGWTAEGPKGQRPIALGHHRFQWLYVTAFVGPATGETVWYLCNRMSKPLFTGLLDLFAKAVGAGPTKRIVLLLDNAGFHTRPNLAVPDGSGWSTFHPTAPNAARRDALWPLVDGPFVNKLVPTLEDLVTIIRARCCDLADRQTEIRRAPTSLGGPKIMPRTNLAEVVSWGYDNDHAVPINSGVLAAFRAHVVDLWRRTFRRRSRKDASIPSQRSRQAVDADRQERRRLAAQAAHPPIPGRTSAASSNTRGGSRMRDPARTDPCGRRAP